MDLYTYLYIDMNIEMNKDMDMAMEIQHGPGHDMNRGAANSVSIRHNKLNQWCHSAVGTVNNVGIRYQVPYYYHSRQCHPAADTVKNVSIGPSKYSP